MLNMGLSSTSSEVRFKANEFKVILDPLCQQCAKDTGDTTMSPTKSTVSRDPKIHRGLGYPGI